MTEADHGVWFGAMVGSTLVARLDLITGISGLACYQSIDASQAPSEQALLTRMQPITVLGG